MGILLSWYQKWHEVKHRDFQYKINNTILATNSFLANNNKIDSGICSYCKKQPKNTPFVFVMFKGQNFWRELREWLNINVNTEISLEDREILFSYTGNNELVN